jgi:hypothetical protein
MDSCSQRRGRPISRPAPHPWQALGVGCIGTSHACATIAARRVEQAGLKVGWSCATGRKHEQRFRQMGQRKMWCERRPSGRRGCFSGSACRTGVDLRPLRNRWLGGQQLGGAQDHRHARGRRHQKASETEPYVALPYRSLRHVAFIPTSHPGTAKAPYRNERAQQSVDWAAPYTDQAAVALRTVGCPPIAGISVLNPSAKWCAACGIGRRQDDPGATCIHLAGSSCTNRTKVAPI